MSELNNKEFNNSNNASNDKFSEGIDAANFSTTYNDAGTGSRVVTCGEDIVKIASEEPTTVTNPTLSRILSLLDPIDFKRAANLRSEKKSLEPRHYVVCTVREVLIKAKQSNLNLYLHNDQVYIYDGEFWSMITRPQIKRFLGEAAERLGVHSSWAQYFKFRDELYQQFLVTANLPSPGVLTDRVLINFKNGTLEITPKKQILREFKYVDFLTYQLNFNYDPNATCPQFEQFLNYVQPGADVQNILAEFLGYLFVKASYLNLQKALILKGEGANGKSVFYEIVYAMLGGQNNISNFSLAKLTDSSGYSRAKFAGKLVNYASEISGRMDTSIFKQLVCCEASEARLPYQEPFVIENYGKLIFNCNILPTDIEQTHAFFRRFLIVHFNVIIANADQDKKLAQKIISTELPGVFRF